VDGSHMVLLAVTVMCFYCTGASVMLQIVCYPTYKLVGEQEFVPFHIAFGKRLLPAAVIPMLLTALGTFALIVARPENIPVWPAIVAALCTAVVLGTTLAFELPRHNQLDRDGKSDAVLAALIRDNLPRTLAWIIASLSLAYMTAVALDRLMM